MISGTIQYAEQDFALSHTAFSPAPPLALWKGAFAMACLGAVIGLGAATLLSKMLEQVLPTLSEYTAWGAVCGAVVLVSVGAWRLSAKLSPAQQAVLQTSQTFLIDERGLQLSTDTAETRMTWPHFVTARTEPDLIVLKTRDATIVVLRPTFFASQVAWDEARRIVAMHVSSPEPLS